MIVTSFAQRGYHEYGRRFIQSFLGNWKDEQLTVYYEKKLPRNHPKNDRLIYKNLYDFEDFNRFNTLIKSSDPLYAGLMQGKKRDERIYNYRFDANRFWKKVYVMTEHALSAAPGKFAWLDADVYVHSSVPDNYLSSLIHPQDAIAALQRKSVYTETGFILFDMEHPLMASFMRQFWEMYSSGAFRFLGEWHDCYVMDMLIDLHSIPVTNLSKKESDHPFIHSELGQYMDHLKGPERKVKGRSDYEENKSKHAGSYWEKPKEEKPELVESKQMALS